MPSYYNEYGNPSTSGNGPHKTPVMIIGHLVIKQKKMRNIKPKLMPLTQHRSLVLH